VAEFYFYIGNGYYEFERPEIVVNPGVRFNITTKRYTVSIKGSVKMEYTLKQNDTLPAIEAQLINADGTPINLDLCGVRFHAQSFDRKKLIVKQAEIIDAENGKVRVKWKEGDTDTAGNYRAEFEIVFTDSTILTVPNDGYFLVKIIPEIG
jgi:hypothetical protein